MSGLGTDLRISLLGPITASAAGGPVYLGPVKQREILAVLALRRRSVVSVQQVAGDLWGDDPPMSAANLVHTYIGRLRRLLGEHAVLHSHRPGYQLAVTGEQVDATVFERHLARGRTALLAGGPDSAQAAFAAALALWTGPRPLDGASGPLAAAERARLAELRLDASESLAAVRLARGDHAGLVAELRSLVAGNPLRERLWALLLTALAYASRRAEALAAFHEVRALLSDRLGVDPSGELTGIYHSLLHDTRPPPPIPSLARVV
ncbi:AfsR/SARP family transcriptional regulator [Sphaerisporangium aureirubrum]|uniref:BTAD domain-containing putative transcriptional regulator n=1 Tax=Sphaerisporangium aureirubrum TaxID=1544736 RepID=A0ABW1NIB1_9ACTN